MNYLSNYGIDEKMLKEIKNYNTKLFLDLDYYESRVKENMDYLLSLGFTNLYALLMYKMEIVFEKKETLQNLISKDKEIISKANKDIMLFDEIGL